jgi:hypothetical protein
MSNSILLQIHYGLGLVLFLTAIAAIFVPKSRQLVDYVLALQIVVGVATWAVLKSAPPAAHWILALVVGGIWPVARGLDKRGRPKPVAMAVCAAGALIVAFIIYLGMKAVGT